MHDPFSKKTEKLRTCLENTEEEITHPEDNALFKKFKVANVYIGRLGGTY